MHISQPGLTFAVPGCSLIATVADDEGLSGRLVGSRLVFTRWDLPPSAENGIRRHALMCVEDPVIHRKATVQGQMAGPTHNHDSRESGTGKEVGR